MDAALEKSKAELEKVSNSWLNLQKNFVVQTEEIDAKEREVGQIQQEVNRLLKEANALRESQTVYQSACYELKCELETTSRDCLAAQTQLNRMNDLNRVVESSYAQYKDKANTEIQRLQRKLEGFRELNDELRDQLRLSDEQVGVSTATAKKAGFEIRKYRDSYDQVQRDLIEHRKELESMKTQLLIKENKIIQLSREGGPRDETIRQLRREVLETKKEWRHHKQIQIQKYERHIQREAFEKAKLQKQLVTLQESQSKN